MSFNLQPAERSDTSYFLELEEDCMRAYAEDEWRAWRPSATVETLNLVGYEIIELEGNPCGCVAMIRDSCHLFLDKLCISPTFQERVIGAFALRVKTSAAAQHGLPINPNVLTINPADRFYKRGGFVLGAEIPEHRRLTKLAG